MKRIKITITEQQHNVLTRASQEQNVTISEIVRRCLILSGIIPDEEIKRGGDTTGKRGANRP